MRRLSWGALSPALSSRPCPCPVGGGSLCALRLETSKVPRRGILLPVLPYPIPYPPLLCRHPPLDEFAQKTAHLCSALWQLHVTCSLQLGAHGGASMFLFPFSPQCITSLLPTLSPCAYFSFCPFQFLLEPLEALKEADERLGLSQGALAEVSTTVTQ